MAKKTNGIQSKNRVKAVRNTSGLIPFVKNDPRINRNGRPKSFDALRALVQEIGAEQINEELTRIAAKVRLMYASKNSGDTATLLAYGWGKPKDEIEIDDKSLTDDERAARIIEILDAARARRTGQTDSEPAASGDAGETSGAPTMDIPSQ